MASISSQKIITFEAVKRELEVAFESVTKMIEEQLNASDDPITLKSDNLIQHIKQRLAQDKFVVQPTHVNGYFHKLPCELRYQIFSDLIASGQLAFMRTSRAMEQEGKTLIAKKGILRINLGANERINCAKPTQKTWDTIQNVDFRISHSYLRIGLIKMSSALGPLPNGKRCTLAIQCKLNRCRIYQFENLTRALHLQEFEEVVLRTWISPKSHKSKLNALDVGYFLGAQKPWESPLGKAHLYLDTDSGTMTFHPRRADR